MGVGQHAEGAFQKRSRAEVGADERSGDQPAAAPVTETELGEAGYEAFALDAEIDDNYVVAVPGGSSARRRRGRLPATDILP